MINISVEKKNNYINKVIIKGHSGYSDYGSDIVCASVSSIAITTVNAITRLDSDLIYFDEKDGFLTIEIKENDRIVNTLVNNMLDLFRELEIDYPKNIKIKNN